MVNETRLPRHPMRFVIRRTGLSADLLRAWEKRYQAVQPGRTPGGQRLYSDDDVERLTLLHQVAGNGRTISQVARLSADQLRTLLVEDAGAQTDSAGEDPETRRGAELTPLMLEAAAALDAQQLERLLRRATLHLGASAAIEQVIVPFLHQIGVRWHENQINPAHEHLATAVVQRTLHWILEGNAPVAEGPAIVLAAPEGERHELGLQIVTAVAAGEGWRVIFLGADLPAETIASATLQSGARLLAISIVSSQGTPALLKRLTALRHALPASVTILVGGAAANQIRDQITAIGMHVLPDLTQLRNFLQTYSSAAS